MLMLASTSLAVPLNTAHRHQHGDASRFNLVHLSKPSGVRVPSQSSKVTCNLHSRHEEGSETTAQGLKPTRRDACTATALALGSLLLETPEARAVQGMTAGRVPGLTPPDENGLQVYTRPAGKSGGHGVGWSEIPPYSFTVPEGWREIATSIADLGGTEVDLRFTEESTGDLAVVVAPVLRFIDVGFNASITIEEIGTPSKVIKAFGPEITGHTIEDEDITAMEQFVDPASGLTYYTYDLKPHMLVAAAAYKNRLYIMTVRSNSAQWRKSKGSIASIRDSFRVAVGEA
mmetsp:Transcript_34147/g.41299  ORF Transcript_34147/g.41299 Transcript_34147/m.41299 type:complete len:288 (-) Transcript_34147:523-1386(-)|eukprot:CAMPEP_0197851550 /NCGR_PEP_ID=MMETSP1438-20131217/18317_1 /TAXON_ID=1461541 /ORGANISM="Pterosperma sp., Strain CCMP1384" /LENGTH=287 /DNA_ID=CAMNT_0043465183 /DNA_START=76 /DNA_END=939 /DNA_ORIENTATION=+